MPKKFSQIKALVVGFGSIGKRHEKNLRALGVGQVFFLRHRNKAELPKNHFSGLKSAIAAKPDLAIVANPSSFHVRTARVLVKAGVHVFIEKPLSDSLNGVNELIEEVRRSRLRAMVGLNFRFHPDLVRIKKIIKSGGIGRVLTSRIEVGQYLPDWHPHENYRQSYAAKKSLGGGVILTLIHEIDYACWLLGMPKEVFCFSNNISLGLDVEEAAEIVMCFGDGSIAEVHLDYLQRSPSRSAQFIGDKGTILWNYFTGKTMLYSAKTRRWKKLPAQKIERNGMFVSEMKNFLEAVSRGRTPGVTLEDGLESLKVALAAKKSSRIKKVIAI